MERLRAAEHARECLDGDASDVVQRLLDGQRDACGLRMKAQLHRPRVFRTEAFLHRLSPNNAGGTVFRDFLKEVVVCVKEERKAGNELIDVHSAIDPVLDIFDAVTERERKFLERGRTGLADVITTDADRVVFRHVLRAVLEGVDNKFHRRLYRIDPFFLRDVFFQDVVLKRARDLLEVGLLLFCDNEIHRKKDRCRCVDGL